ncbi:hypothetical protein DMA11_20145 [Marinilabiliaceae bacterium JC017]|nr:hypothetical protein DMA11_20145 [Marinilabiliaceae bacterium JC017]
MNASLKHQPLNMVVFAIFFFCNPLLYSQNDTIRQLNYELESKPVNTHYSIFLQLGQQAKKTSDKLDYYHHAVEAASYYNSQPILIETYLSAAEGCYQIPSFQWARQYYQQAIELALDLEKTDALATANHHLGRITSRQQQYTSAIEYLKKAIHYYTKAGKNQETGAVYNSIGAVYWYQRNYPKALEFFHQALRLGKEHNDLRLEQKAHGNIGVIYETLAQYDKALAEQTQAFELASQLNLDKAKASSYNNIGNIYLATHHYEKAKDNYLASLELFSSLNDQEGKSTCYNNLGDTYLGQNEISQALHCYQLMLNYEESVHDTIDIALAYTNMGNTYLTAGQYPEAIIHFQNALSLLSLFNDIAMEGELHLLIGEALIAMDDINLAESYFFRCIDICSTIGDRRLLAKAYNNIAHLYLQQKEYKKAFEFKNLYATLKDTINNEKSLENMARMDAIFNSIKQDEVISELQNDNLSFSESIAKLKSSKIILFIASIFLFIIALFLFLLFRFKQKTSLELKKTNKQLSKLNATKDKFFSIIAHDLKSPFTSLMGFSEMLSLHAEHKNTNEVIEYSQIIHNSTKKLFNLVENLLKWSRTQLGTTKYYPEVVDISIHSNNIISLLRFNAEEKDIVITSKIEKELLGWADINLFSTVMRNLLSNAIKFSQVGSIIKVNGYRINEDIQLSVTDTGIGIRREHLDKLFKTGSNVTRKGTFNEKGTGLGLLLCKEFVEINKGAIWAESEYGNGSTFYFTIPGHSEKQKTEYYD